MYTDGGGGNVHRPISLTLSESLNLGCDNQTFIIESTLLKLCFVLSETRSHLRRLWLDGLELKQRHLSEFL
jgi:hypothetical protein